MARIKIEDLPVMEELSEQELNNIAGGLTGLTASHPVLTTPIVSPILTKPIFNPGIDPVAHRYT